MKFQIEDAIMLLRRTPSTLQALLQGLPQGYIRSTEGAGTWSAQDVVGHLLHGDEGDWMGRIQTILNYGEKQPFASFNRTAMFEKYKDYSLDQLLEAFAHVRYHNVEELAQLCITPDQLMLTGSHPTFGTVTLGQLLSTWVVHDLNHMAQIVEVMAHQYHEEVGPWKAYLGILTRPILTE